MLLLLTYRAFHIYTPTHSLTQQLRQATLQYQVNVQRAHLQERKALLEGSDEALRRREIK